MYRNVTSTDPRKAIIVKAIKQASGASKVTLVHEVEPNIFQGHAQVSGKRVNGWTRHAQFESLGYWRTSFDSGETWKEDDLL